MKSLASHQPKDALWMPGQLADGNVGLFSSVRAERFHNKWIGEPNSGCWIWTGEVCNGYGCLTHNGKRLAAHRVSYEMHHGTIPSGLGVLHKCDTPACVNPLHLFLGDNAANTADMCRKGRQHRGERASNSRLTETVVREIRASSNATDASRRFGLPKRTVRDVLSRRTWGWLT